MVSTPKEKASSNWLHTFASHILYISARKHSKSVLRLVKCNDHSSSSSSRSFGTLPKDALRTLLLQLSLLLAFLFVILPSLPLIKLNSSLRLLLQIPPWMIPALFLHLHPPPTHVYLPIDSLTMMNFLPQCTRWYTRTLLRC